MPSVTGAQAAFCAPRPPGAAPQASQQGLSWRGGASPPGTPQSPNTRPRGSWRGFPRSPSLSRPTPRLRLASPERVSRCSQLVLQVETGFPLPLPVPSGHLAPRPSHGARRLCRPAASFLAPSLEHWHGCRTSPWPSLGPVALRHGRAAQAPAGTRDSGRSLAHCVNGCSHSST